MLRLLPSPIESGKMKYLSIHLYAVFERIVRLDLEMVEAITPEQLAHCCTRALRGPALMEECIVSIPALTLSTVGRQLPLCLALVGDHEPDTRRSIPRSG
jgi:hypothetical protein